MRCSTLPDRYPDLSRLGCTVLAPLYSRWKVRVGSYSQHPCSMKDSHLRVLPVPPGKKEHDKVDPLLKLKELVCFLRDIICRTWLRCGHIGQTGKRFDPPGQIHQSGHQGDACSSFTCGLRRGKYFFRKRDIGVRVANIDDLQSRLRTKQGLKRERSVQELVPDAHASSPNTGHQQRAREAFRVLLY